MYRLRTVVPVAKSHKGLSILRVSKVLKYRLRKRVRYGLQKLIAVLVVATSFSRSCI